jgi:lipoprotein-anchoring transpeptidase ErfK/SrfK
MRSGNTIRPVQAEKEIIISIDNQQLYRFEDGRIISTHPVSTGVAGHRTPPGDYGVRRKSLKAWSNKYECMMLNWMAITYDGQFGIHALQGRSYLKRLGRPASHGCIRLSHDDAKMMYEWADIGTPVTIVSEFDPEPYLPKTTMQASTQSGFNAVVF